MDARPSPTVALLDVLSATLTGDAAATTVTLTPTAGRPVAMFRIKRLASSTGNIRWNASTATTVNGSNGYLLTAADWDSGWIPAQTTALKVFAVTSNADYEIMRIG